MTDKLLLTVKNVYGRCLIYPNCETSKKLVKLTGKVTFTEQDLEVLKDLGFKLEISAGV